MLNYLSVMISQMRWIDFFDIAIIAFAIYKILKFAQETRAAQLIKGLVVLLVVTVASDVCKLYTVNWVLDNFLKVGIIALIVIFQPEIRRGLQYLGSRGMMRGRSVSEMGEESAEGLTNQIMEALMNFSKTRTGALIVVERTTILGEAIESGTKINADITKELLMNIFYVGAPLHDGAAVIRGHKLVAAGCVLPLTSNNKLSSDLGTRHRAGIGITEISDAVSIIVSEETGAMSVALNGHISRFLDEQAMRTVLKGLFLHEETEKKYFVSRFNDIMKGRNSGE